jgi:hypothetical protein
VQAAGPPSPAKPAAATACEECKGRHKPDKIVQCDRCEKGWHQFCLAPPLEAPPAGEWVCPECRSLGECFAAAKGIGLSGLLLLAYAGQCAWARFHHHLPLLSLHWPSRPQSLSLPPYNIQYTPYNHTIYPPRLT